MCGNGRGGKGQMSQVRDDLQNPDDASGCSTAKILDGWKIEDSEDPFFSK
jgi:hypothetical protein